jgi:hypothetical protein
VLHQALGTPQLQRGPGDTELGLAIGNVRQQVMQFGSAPGLIGQACRSPRPLQQRVAPRQIDRASVVGVHQRQLDRGVPLVEVGDTR